MPMFIFYDQICFLLSRIARQPFFFFAKWKATNVVEANAAPSVERVHSATCAAQQACRVCDKEAASERVRQIRFLKPNWRVSFLIMTPRTAPPHSEPLVHKPSIN